MTRTGWIAVLFLLGLLVGNASLAIGQTVDNAKPVAFFRAFGVSENTATAVLLDGTFSSDPDGDIASFQWLFGDGTTGSGATVEHTYPQIGRFEVTLVVIDNRGASHMVTKTIDLSELEPQSESTAQSSNTGASSRPPVARTSAPEGYEVGNRSPDFTLPTLDADIAQLSTYLGQVVIVDFWFLTCSGCVASLPHLEELRLRFEDEGLVILIVVLDRDPAEAKDFFAENEYDGFILAHEHDLSRPTRTAYGVGGTPHAFLIDRSGAIRFSGKPYNLTAELVESWL